MSPALSCSRACFRRVTKKLTSQGPEGGPWPTAGGDWAVRARPLSNGTLRTGTGAIWEAAPSRRSPPVRCRGPGPRAAGCEGPRARGRAELPAHRNQVIINVCWLKVLIFRVSGCTKRLRRAIWVSPWVGRSAGAGAQGWFLPGKGRPAEASL